jgi:hypothetical protein
MLYGSKCKCGTDGYLSLLVYGNVAVREGADAEVVCWSCAITHGVIAEERKSDIISNPERPNTTSDAT